MCPTHQIDEPTRLAAVIELVHNASRNSTNDPIDLYRLHDYFTPTDEPEDDVADANQNVGYDFGYDRPDLGEYEFVDEEMREYLEGYLEMFWPGPELLWVREYESPVGSDVEGEDEDEGENENESGTVEDEQQVGGDGDGDAMRTNTDSTTTAADAGEEQDLSANSEHTNNPDTLAAPASSNTGRQQATRPATSNDASAGESQAQND